MGIGTTNPNAKLDVIGDINCDYNTVPNVTYTNGLIDNYAPNPDETIIIFNSNGSISFPQDTICEILLVGGGAAGGVCSSPGSVASAGGGGGAVVHITNGIVKKGSYNITIGQGGTSGGQSGGDTIAFGVTAKGGGGTPGTGASTSYILGNDGGSGGGVQSSSGASTTNSLIYGGNVIKSTFETINNTNLSNNAIVYGNKGGNVLATSSTSIITSAGGGGAGTIGSNGGTTGTPHGGDGIPIYIRNIKVYYGAGGGGGAYNIDAGNGGIGGGGGGGAYFDNYNLQDYGFNVKAYPPAALHPFTSKEKTLIGQNYGNGKYIVNYSSDFSTNNLRLDYIFGDNNIQNEGGHSIGSDYSVEGNYIKRNYITQYYYGEWVTLKFPYKIYLKYVKIFQRYNLESRSPKNYKIYGKNDDDNNWTELIYTENATYTSHIHTSSEITNPSISYNTYAIVVNSLIGNGTILNFNGLQFFGYRGVSKGGTFNSISISPTLNSCGTYTTSATGNNAKGGIGLSNTGSGGGGAGYGSIVGKGGSGTVIVKWKKNNYNSIINNNYSLNTNSIISKKGTFNSDIIIPEIYDNFGVLQDYTKFKTIDCSYYYEFTNITKTTVPYMIYFLEDTLCEILVVAGGGGGSGYIGGGGGGGAVVYIPSAMLSAGGYNIEVGDGGMPSLNNANSSNGLNSSISKIGGGFKDIIAEGGGGSAGYSTGWGIIGGSGGGAASCHVSILNKGGNKGFLSSTGIFDGYIYGNKGGDNTTTRTSDTGITNACGGGGAGAAAKNTDPNSEYGDGGDGIQINIDGNNYYYGGGGGGGSYQS